MKLDKEKQNPLSDSDLKYFKLRCEFFKKENKFLFGGFKEPLFTDLQWRLIYLLRSNILLCEKRGIRMKMSIRAKGIYKKWFTKADKKLSLTKQKTKAHRADERKYTIFDFDHLIQSFVHNGKSSKNGGTIEILGTRVGVSSRKLQAFKEKGIKCVFCGIEPVFAAIEKENHCNTHCHINFYGIDTYRHEVLFTIDHIVPRSLGGSNRQSNLQVTCICCNRIKSDKIQPGTGELR